MVHKYYNLLLSFKPGKLYNLKIFYQVGIKKRTLNLLFKIDEPLEVTVIQAKNEKEAEILTKNLKDDSLKVNAKEADLNDMKPAKIKGNVETDMSALGFTFRDFFKKRFMQVQTKNCFLERINIQDDTDKIFEYFTGGATKELLILDEKREQETFQAARFSLQTSQIDDPNYYFHIFGSGKKVAGKPALIEEIFVKKHKLTLLEELSDGTKLKKVIPFQFFPVLRVNKEIYGDGRQIDYNAFYKDRKVVSCTFLGIYIVDKTRKVFEDEEFVNE